MATATGIYHRTYRAELALRHTLGAGRPWSEWCFGRE